MWNFQLVLSEQPAQRVNRHRRFLRWQLLRQQQRVNRQNLGRVGGVGESSNPVTGELSKILCGSFSVGRSVGQSGGRRLQKCGELPPEGGHTKKTNCWLQTSRPRGASRGGRGRRGSAGRWRGCAPATNATMICPWQQKRMRFFGSSFRKFAANSFRQRRRIPAIFVANFGEK